MYDRYRWTDASVRRNRLTREYEPLQPFFLMTLAEEIGCRTFLDVGANIGVYSLFATLVSSFERIIAFEPDPQTVTELSTNLALNHLEKRVEICRHPVSDSRRNLRFGVVGKLSGANSVVDTTIHDKAAFCQEMELEATSLDDFLPEPIVPLCIKIDVEGHECNVVAGAASLLSTAEAVIQLEIYENDRGTERNLQDLGYSRLTQIGPDHYFTNIDALRDQTAIVAAYERALREMIAYNHRSKPLVVSVGDFALQLTGKSASAARRLRQFISNRH